ncbi:uncharacterized protein LOC125232166 isoform X2 [Leguminivora glycinivorella]|uniref:uncharacterized protein LOC125232166 isoform X2 n=1 Tax=Leguminivora glycinivorella TaxID=1035111 RepID=UPI00200DC997|nr:uncharacterized protein LOC125232166 isoform X2 [Leguminivora glycinivorella]
MGAGALRAAGETTTTEKPDWTRSWHFFFFEFERPGATIFIAGISIEQELLYDVWIWYSSVYVPVMILIMCVVLTASVWALDLRLFRALIATFAVIFYLFMFYCIIFVQTEKRKIFSTTTMTSTTTTPCPWCPICLTGTCTVPTSTSGKRKLRTFELLQLGNL